MIKRFLSFFLVLCILCSLAACNAAPKETVPPETLPKQEGFVDKTGFKVPDPLPYPDYTFDSAPSIERLRATAVRAMRDLLTIQWSTATDISYYKTGPINSKNFQHAKDTLYGGTLYSSASTGIFQFFEYYNQETGRLEYPGTSDELKQELGSSCADALIWSLCTVSCTINGAFYPSTMVQKNGFLPVGGYTYDESVTSFYKLPTQNIVEQNGKDVMLEAYAQVQAADAFVSTPDDHGIMVISRPYVQRDENGKIIPEESYVYIQDQRGGAGAGFYEEKVGSHIVRYSGRTKAKYTFAELYNKAYIPVAPAEFLGIKEYENAYVKVSEGPCTTLEELLQLQVESNYPIAVVNVIVADSFGNKTVIDRELTGGDKVGGPPRVIALNQLAALTEFAQSEYNVPSYILQIEVVTSTGERFLPIEFPIN